MNLPSKISGNFMLENFVVALTAQWYFPEERQIDWTQKQHGNRVSIVR
jgi:hypothetical protein